MIILLVFSVLSLISALLGAAFLAGYKKLAFRWEDSLGVFAAGLLLGTVFLDLLPESLRLSGSSVYFLLGGLLVFYLIEQFLRTHSHHPGERGHYHILLPATLSGFFLHNLIDGIALGSVLAHSPALGVTVGTAIVAHRFSDGLTNASVMLHSRCSLRWVFLWVFLLGATMVAAAWLAFYLALQGSGFFLGSLLGLSAGVLLYVAAVHLLPQSRKKPSFGNFATLLVGVLLIAWLLKLLGAE